MKKLIFFFVTLIIVEISIAQNIVRGKVIDAVTKEPVELANVMDTYTFRTGMTSKNGDFVLNKVDGDSLLVSVIGYKSRKIRADYVKRMIIELGEGEMNLTEVTITNNQISGNTFKVLSSFDLNRQPAKSAQDLLRLIPGLFIAQHQGGGKAEQIFLRGFDADHGTDVNISVDGIPVNMVSHAHGEGYADLHFLIPETVSGYDFGKGPYSVDKGDFATGGYVAYHTKAALDQDEVKIEAGQFNTLRELVMLNLLTEQAKKRGQTAYVAAEHLYTNGGPFTLPEHFTRVNLFGKFNTNIGKESKLAFEASNMQSKWRSAGELPDRSVAEGYISSRFGAIDSLQGGNTSRTNISLKLTSSLRSNWIIENQLWYSHYYFNLTSNFTFYYYFPQTGDEFRQREMRDLGGYNSKISKSTVLNNVSYATTIGAGFRYDRISPIELDHIRNGQFLEYLQFGRTREMSSNIYFDETLSLNKWLFSVGARADYFHFNYLNLAPISDSYASKIFSEVNPNAQKFAVSPKVFIEYTFSKDIQFYYKAGQGFHSNDARVAVANRGTEVLPLAYGSDLGVNWKPFSGLYINTALWYLFLQQEFTFGGDLIDQPAGPVSPSGRTVREGVDFSLRYQLTKWLFANLNANIAKPSYIDSAKGNGYVPFAPTFTSTAGLDIKLKNGINGGISYRYLHNRAANADYTLTARGYFISDLTMNYSQKKYEIGIAVENLFNHSWDESQFEYTSLLKGETKSVDQVSYTPGVPFFARLHLAVFFK